jgi:hypothetical protein
MADPRDEHLRRQSEWPREKRTPVAHYQTADGVLKSDRSLVGPLRMGTAPGAGPNGMLRDGNASDFGMDRVSPRRFDPIGSHNTRAPEREASSLLSRETRGNRRED